jgi:hypothetical protein
MKKSVATIFPRLSFVVWFFGQNAGALVVGLRRSSSA